ncbi:MAG: hypothetical protein NTU73_01960 [Ignavibacteriae bacterium]|nr:hypothetical protein [Ignavibacteriota bacterium]
MDAILEKLLEVGKIESPPKLEGKMLNTYLVPDRNKIIAYKTKLEKENKQNPAPIVEAVENNTEQK